MVTTQLADEQMTTPKAAECGSSSCCPAVACQALLLVQDCLNSSAAQLYMEGPTHSVDGYWEGGKWNHSGKLLWEGAMVQKDRGVICYKHE